MSYSTAILVPAISHGVQTHQYNGGEDYNGASVPAASHYSNVGNSQTLLYSFNDFDGTIEVQGTLVTNPSDTDWATIFVIQSQTGSLSGAKILPGRYSNIRAVVKSFSAGVINDVRIMY